MPTKVRDLPERAGVECPKKTGEMDESMSCRWCPNFGPCWEAMIRACEAEA